MTKGDQSFVLTADEAQGVRINGSQHKLIHFTVRDDSTGTCPDHLVLDVSHTTNAGMTLNFAADILTSHPNLSSSLKLTGTPGSLGASYTLRAEPILLEGLQEVDLTYGATNISVQLLGDFKNDLEGRGHLKCASVKVGKGMYAYPTKDSNGEATMIINNRTPASSRCIEIGDLKSHSNIYNIECRDPTNKARIRVAPDKVQMDGNIECVLSETEAVSYMSPSGSAVYKVDADGNVFATSYVAMSDARMKCNIQRLETQSSMDILRKLQCYSYNFCFGDQDLHYGLLADEVAQILPDIVKGTRDTRRSIVYDELIPHLIVATQKIDRDLRARQCSWGCYAVTVVLTAVFCSACFSCGTSSKWLCQHL